MLELLMCLGFLHKVFPPSEEERLRIKKQRKRFWWAVFGVVALCGLIAAGCWYMSSSPSNPKEKVSDDTVVEKIDVDSEVGKIIGKNYKNAEKILADNIDKMHAMAKALMQYETIDDNQIQDIMAGKKPREPEETQTVKKRKPRVTKAKKETTKAKDKDSTTETSTVVLEEAIQDKK